MAVNVQQKTSSCLSYLDSAAYRPGLELAAGRDITHKLIETNAELDLKVYLFYLKLTFILLLLSVIIYLQVSPTSENRLKQTARGRPYKRNDGGM